MTRRWASVLGVAAVLAGVGYMAARALVWEPRRIDVETSEVRLDGWPADAAAARVVLLADIHASRYDAERVKRLVQTALSLKPEVVIMLGDYAYALDRRYSMPEEDLAALLEPLSDYCPVYFVLGNHDLFPRQKARRALEERGMVFVENKSVRLHFANGCQAELRGAAYVDAPCGEWAYRELYSKEKLPADVPLIAAMHSPYPFEIYVRWADLALAAHTHGGQVCLPGGSPLVTRGVWGKEEMRAGWHRTPAGKPLYITRGLGLSTVPMRLFCPPEVSLLLLYGSGRDLPDRQPAAR